MVLFWFNYSITFNKKVPVPWKPQVMSLVWLLFILIKCYKHAEIQHNCQRERYIVDGDDLMDREKVLEIINNSNGIISTKDARSYGISRMTLHRLKEQWGLFD